MYLPDRATVGGTLRALWRHNAVRLRELHEEG
jgi:hypothetical protein